MVLNKFVNCNRIHWFIFTFSCCNHLSNGAQINYESWYVSSNNIWKGLDSQDEEEINPGYISAVSRSSRQYVYQNISFLFRMVGVFIFFNHVNRSCHRYKAREPMSLPIGTDFYCSHERESTTTITTAATARVRYGHNFQQTHIAASLNKSSSISYSVFHRPHWYTRVTHTTAHKDHFHPLLRGSCYKPIRCFAHPRWTRM